MKLPFTLEQFLDIFRQYNISVWPIQVVLVVLALAATYFSIFKRSYSDKIIVSVLTFLWLWMGIVYHLIHFSSINNAAIVFGLLFIIQALLIFYLGIIKNKLRFQFSLNRYGITGIVLILFALIVYPLLAYRLGHVYPSLPTFGLPCPTTIFTFGILLFSSSRVPVIVIIIPAIWSIIGSSAAASLGMKEDTGLLIAFLICTIMTIYKNKRLKKVSLS
ncbi:MAG TPA: DUF6064 family protein [Chitinophagaceae bacterium]|nr:DUF6064 family protein [Chitinophagaceae bacterium]